jgi:hypothetical protein
MLLFLIAEPKAQLPIVDKAIEHAGGPLCHNAVVKWVLNDPSEPGPITFESKRKGGEFDIRFRVDAKLEGKPFTRQIHVTNTSVEQIDNGEQGELGEDEKKQARKDGFYMEYLKRLPCQLNDPSVFKEDLGVEKWGKQELQKVKVTFDPPGHVFYMWFDPKTGRLHQFGYHDDEGVRFHRAVKFHEIKGMVLYDQEKFELPGKGHDSAKINPAYVKKMKRLGVAKLSKIEVEPLLPDQPSSRPATK